MISAHPAAANFSHGVRLARAAIDKGVDVYLYCVDEAVVGLGDPALRDLVPRGLRLFACAYGIQRRNLSARPEVVLAGLTVVNDLMAATDRFVAFN